jgi:hypothetical protein
MSGDVYSFHQKIATYDSLGSVLALFGTSLIFSRFSTSDKQWVFGVLCYFAGLILMVVSVYDYNVKEKQPATIAEMVQHNRKVLRRGESSRDGAMILSGVSGLLIFAGAFQATRSYWNTGQFGILGTVVYAGGWVGKAFAGSMNADSQVENERLMYTMLGAGTVVLGSLNLPSAYSLPVAGVGYGLYTIGTSSLISSLQ